jgi:hypothetical protein
MQHSFYLDVVSCLVDDGFSLDEEQLVREAQEMLTR